MEDKKQLIDFLIQCIASKEEKFTVVEDAKLVYKEESTKSKEVNVESKSFELGLKSNKSDNTRYVEFLQPGEPDDYIGQVRIEEKHAELKELIKAKNDKRIINGDKFDIILILEYGPMTMNILDMHISRKITCDGGENDIELLIYDKNTGVFSLNQWRVMSSAASSGLQEGQ